MTKIWPHEVKKKRFMQVCKRSLIGGVWNCL
jgi:hypothetical protein